MLKRFVYRFCGYQRLKRKTFMWYHSLGKKIRCNCEVSNWH